MRRTARHSLFAMVLAELMPAQVIAQPIEIPLGQQQTVDNLFGSVKTLLSRYERASRVRIIVSIPASRGDLIESFPLVDKLRVVTHEASDEVMRLSVQPQNVKPYQACPWLLEVQDPGAPVQAGTRLLVTGGDRLPVSRGSQFRVISTAPLSAQIYAFAETEGEGIQDLIADPREDIPVLPVPGSLRVLLAVSPEVSAVLEDLQTILARSTDTAVMIPGFFDGWDEPVMRGRGISPDVQRISREMIADASSPSSKGKDIFFEDHLSRCSLILDIDGE